MATPGKFTLAQFRAGLRALQGATIRPGRGLVGVVGERQLVDLDAMLAERKPRAKRRGRSV